MKSHIAVVFLFLTCLPASAEVEVKEDRFTKTTTIGTVPKLTEKDGQPAVTVLSALTKDKTTASLLLVTSSKSWRYLKCHSSAWLVDDEPFPMPKAKHDGTVGRGYVMEYLIITPLTQQQVARLGAATKVEYKLCNDEYQVAPTELEDLKKFHELLLEHKAWGAGS